MMRKARQNPGKVKQIELLIQTYRERTSPLKMGGSFEVERTGTTEHDYHKE